MKLRRANSVEAPKLVDILVEQHAHSRYADVCKIDEQIARKLLAAAIHRHGGKNEGATFVMVAVDDGDEPVAFIFGSLVRIYMIGDRLAASDNFLIGRKGVSGMVLNQLFSAYVSWALDNPKVAEIGGSWSTAIEGSEGFSGILERRGFTKLGEVWSILTHGVREKGIAA